MNYKDLKMFLRICEKYNLEVSWENLNDFKKALRYFK